MFFLLLIKKNCKKKIVFQHVKVSFNPECDNTTDKTFNIYLAILFFQLCWWNLQRPSAAPNPLQMVS